MLKRFTQISASDIATCWWKGASLGEMTQAGFPVPNGFVLTTAAFWTDVHQRDDEVLHAFDQLNCKFVAVRSSGTKEDGNEDSFAGQFDTYLFVTKEKLIEQILECHASVKSDRILAYCASKGINPDDIKVAVVVQKMVNSESAGVCFTANPITGNSDEVMIEAWYGLGEAVVSGMITPDNYVVKKSNISCRDGSINRPNNENHINENHISDTLTVRPYDYDDIQKNISNQTKKIVLDIEKGGTREESVEATIAGIQKLSDEHIFQLAEYAKKIEEHYGKPMDIEWAIEGGELFILQARPITTLGKEENRKNKKDLYKEFMDNSKDAKICIYSLKCSMFCCGFNQFLQNKHSIKLKDGKSYFLLLYRWNDIYTAMLDESLYIEHSKEMFRKFMAWIYSLDTLKSEFDGFYERADRLYQEKIVDAKKTLTKAVDLFVLVIAKTLYLELFDKSIVEEILDKKIGAAQRENLVNYDFEHFDKRWTRKVWESTKPEEVDYVFQDYYFLPSPAEVSRLWAQKRKEKKENSELITEDTTIFTEDWENFTRFIIKARDLRKDTTSKLLTLMCKSIRLLYPSVPDYLLAQINPFEIIQDTPPSLELLQQRASSPYIFLGRDEENFEYDYSKERFDKIVNLIISTEKTNELKGNIANKGVYTGYVRVIFDVKGDSSRFQEWNILVTWMTRPEFVPLMKKAGAIITDEWWITSHAAIVSRELGIPCIIGTKNATRILKDGDLVEVDADNGVVKILEQ